MRRQEPAERRPESGLHARPFGNTAHEIWNTADPAHPQLVTRVVENLKGTHKSWWECDTGIAYLVSGVPGWRVPRMTQVFDLSDPAHPKKVRDFGLPGQQPEAGRPVHRQKPADPVGATIGAFGPTWVAGHASA